MSLDIDGWKEFRVGDLFPKVKLRHFQSIPETTGNIPFISSKSDNNGVAAMVDEEAIKGNCITVSTNGDCFDCFYQPEDIALSCDAEALYNSNINSYTAMFIITILTAEKYKWAYGRKPKNNKVYDTIIKLPVNSDGNPDWHFMENYIKSLYYKPLTTKNKTGQSFALNVKEWKEFKIKNIFTVELAKGDIKLDEVDSGTIPLVSSGETNNGIVGYIDINGDGKSKIFPSNRITLDMFGNAFYQDEQFYAVSHGRVNILNPKFVLTKNIGLFISAIIKQEQYKYSYGRAIYSGVAENMDIKLPVDSGGNPDWQFMENYIKSLPYGDRL